MPAMRPGPRPSLPRRLEDARKRYRRRAARPPCPTGAERPIEVVLRGHATDSLPKPATRSSASRAGAQRLVSAIEAELVGPDRDIEDRRGLCVSQAQVVVDDEGRPMVGRQSLEAALQLVPVRERARRVGDAR